VAFGRVSSGCPYPSEHALSVLDLRVVGSHDVGTHTIFVGELTGSRIVGQGVPMTYAYYREELGGKTPPTAPTYTASAMAQTLARAKRDDGDTPPTSATERRTVMQKYVCDVCGYIYDPEAGDPESDVAPGTAFADLPDDWVCPECGVGKDDFSPVE